MKIKKEKYKIKISELNDTIDKINQELSAMTIEYKEFKLSTE
jgi:hypothetical protein